MSFGWDLASIFSFLKSFSHSKLTLQLQTAESKENYFPNFWQISSWTCRWVLVVQRPDKTQIANLDTPMLLLLNLIFVAYESHTIKQDRICSIFWCICCLSEVWNSFDSYFFYIWNQISCEWFINILFVVCDSFSITFNVILVNDLLLLHLSVLHCLNLSQLKWFFVLLWFFSHETPSVLVLGNSL